MTDTLRWNLLLLTASQAQKEVSHNEALLAIDRVLHLAVHNRSLPQPPADARPGDSLIVASMPDEAWADNAGMLASFDGDGWTLAVPREGCLVWIRNEAALAVFHDGGWRTIATLALEQ